MVKVKRKNPLVGGRRKRIHGKKLLEYIYNSCLDYSTEKIKSQGVKL